MSYLNADERERLKKDLEELNYNQARWRVRGLDNQIRLAYYRNAAMPTELHTKYELKSLGAYVTLVEKVTLVDAGKAGRKDQVYDYIRAVVEPTPYNQS